jgi:FlaA1/EpsC-like NDP-sugar epimerase
VTLTQPPLGDFSTSVFVIDAFICATLIVASRFLERTSVRALHWLRYRDAGERVLIVGAGRTGRSMLRELRDTPGHKVVGFVDDDPRLWGRRINGVAVVSGTTGVAAALERSRPDTVLVTIPDAPRDRLDEVVTACDDVGVSCRFVRREDLDPAVVLGANA